MKISDTMQGLNVLEWLLQPNNQRNKTIEHRKVTVMTPEEITKTLGWRVEYLRDRINQWTQTELSEQLSKRLHRRVSQGYISKIEKNAIDPPRSIIAALAYVFNVNGEYLLLTGDDPTPQKIEEDMDIYMSEEAGKAAEIVDKLSPQKRADMVSMLSRAAEDERAAREKRAAEFSKLMSIVEGELGSEARQRLERSIVATVSGVGENQSLPKSHPVRN